MFLKKEYTISGRKANICGFLLVVPTVLLTGVPYLLIWREPGTGWRDGFISVISRNKEILQQAIDAGWWLLLLFLAGVVLHELIHGICMAGFAKNGRKAVSFGFNIKALAPYAHCKEPLPVAAYRISLIMPAVLMGDIPVLAGWISGNILVLLFGTLFTLAAAGDFIILWMSRGIETGLLQDHPDKIGFIRIETSTF